MFIKIYYDEYASELFEFIELHYINDVICVLTRNNELKTFCRKDIDGFEIGYASHFKVEQCMLEEEQK